MPCPFFRLQGRQAVPILVCGRLCVASSSCHGKIMAGKKAQQWNTLTLQTSNTSTDTASSPTLSSLRPVCLWSSLSPAGKEKYQRHQMHRLDPQLNYNTHLASWQPIGPNPQYPMSVANRHHSFPHTPPPARHATPRFEMFFFPHSLTALA